eukprot:jgi/Mesvir1/14400/Mv09786-RA.1
MALLPVAMEEHMTWALASRLATLGARTKTLNSSQSLGCRERAHLQPQAGGAPASCSPSSQRTARETACAQAPENNAAVPSSPPLLRQLESDLAWWLVGSQGA